MLVRLMLTGPGSYGFMWSHADPVFAQTVACPVCSGVCDLHDVVDFNKSCEENRGKFTRLSGRPVYYSVCTTCLFCFAPELCAWSTDRFATEIYNKDYAKFDPDYESARPTGNARDLAATLAGQEGRIRHLDYGGGNGLLSQLMRERGFDSTSYDPFVDTGVDPAALGQFDLITAYEVFEHAPDVHALMSNLVALRRDDGVVMFSTLLSDGQIAHNQRLSWWYAAPRNGHISLFSRGSLARLAGHYRLAFGIFNAGSHAMWTTPPAWARKLFR
jgi:SAM-dependent methyltransferase